MKSSDRAMRKRIKLHASILVGSVAAVLIVIELAVGFSQLGWGRDVGVDYRIYMDATTRWLSDGSYFLPRQLAGPYQLQMGDVFYPPVALWLFAPFTLLPAVVWWAVPIAITAAALVHLRPAPWTIALSLVVFLCPKYLEFVFDGNPGMYLVAALAAAAAWGTPASFVLFKSSLFPLALFGMRSRGWWYGLAALAVLSLPVLPLTLTWGCARCAARQLDILAARLASVCASAALVGWLNAPGANRSSSAGCTLVLLADARGFLTTQRSEDSYRAVTMPR